MASREDEDPRWVLEARLGKIHLYGREEEMVRQDQNARRKNVRSKAVGRSLLSPERVLNAHVRCLFKLRIM
jgi:hypothetical protein